jgi:hypothetical protein
MEHWIYIAKWIAAVMGVLVLIGVGILSWLLTHPLD